MKSHPDTRSCIALAVALLLAPLTGFGQGTLTLANPHWNITLSDFGYSDFLLDNTPGFEGREYLSGEWGAAVAYEVAGHAAVTPQWLEPHFVYPDWVTNSTFHVVSPLVQTGWNADSLPVAESVIANQDLQITLRHEMLDTVLGTPMGTKAASAAGTGVLINSNRYVLKQTSTLRNISGAAISNLQLFQLLHGLQSQRGVYDPRSYAGPLSEFHYDVTGAGVDAGAIGAGSSSAGLEDFVGFHASLAPSAYEIGPYGIEGNGVDNHSSGKPSDGVHLSIEANWQTAPYSSRLNTDAFAPAQRWIAGTQRWNLGNLAAGQSVSHDVVLSLATGTRVTAGVDSSGSCNGGSSVPGGLDYQFSGVSAGGTCFAEFSRADEEEVAVRIAGGEFDHFTFPTPGSPVQLWDVAFNGSYSAEVQLTFAYDGTLLPAGFDESTLSIQQFSGGTWQKLPGVVNPASHSIAVTTTLLGVFALGVDGGVTFQIDAAVSPANSGLITGAGSYAQAAGVTLVATPGPGYAFANWTEGGNPVSPSPGYTFAAQANRSLVANFVPVGSAKTISTVSTPSNGGATRGDGAYAVGAPATVVATPNPGYKFSKWLVHDVNVSESSSYTFPVSGDLTLVAKFKPVFLVTVSAEPAVGGTAEADSAKYESGEKAVMKAFPEPGYSFVNWTQNGVPVSHDATFTFTVSGNRELVANFALGHRIDVISDPKTAGSGSGEGVYGDGVPVTLRAEAKPGYLFTNWTENGIVVSTSAEYPFTSSSDRLLVANFIALPELTSTRLTPEMILLKWPAGASGWFLQESAGLDPHSWVDSTYAVTIVGTEKQVTVPMAHERRKFFRLNYP